LTIPASYDVQILPGVINGGGSALDLNGLMLTKNSRVPIGTVRSFSSAAAVSAFFGPTSTEFADATVYFSGYENATATPGALLVAQYPATPVAAWLRGGSVAGLTIAQLDALSGSLSIVMDGYPHSAATVNLSGATSFSAAAALIQAAIDAIAPVEATFTGSISGTTLTVSSVASGTLSIGQTIPSAGVAANTIITGLGTGTGLAGTYTVSVSQAVSSESMTAVATAPTVTYDSLSGGFVVTSGITGAPSMAAFATGTLADALMLTQATGATLSQGAAATTPGAFMNALTLLTQNWATFWTAFDPDSGTGNAQKLQFAQWVNSTNNRYAYVAWDTDITPSLSTTASTSVGALIAAAGLSGTVPIWVPVGSNLHHAAFFCGMVAATDVERLNGNITHKFRTQSGLVASVADQQTATNLKANGYNCVGAIATANQPFVYYREGTISGPFQWSNTYVNEIWLNNALQLSVLEFMTQVGSVPYNHTGAGLIEAACLDPIAQALNFGAIVTGVALSNAQIAEITNRVGFDVSATLFDRGWYMQVQVATSQVRQARTSPPILFFYTDGGSVHNIVIPSIDVQ
jgi:hypothetical protein